MSMLVTCPNCGPREVPELRCAGETTKRPTSTPTVRELNEYIYFRRNVVGDAARVVVLPRPARTGSSPSATRTRTRSRRRGTRSAPRVSGSRRATAASGSTARSRSRSRSRASPSRASRATRSARRCTRSGSGSSRAASSTTARAGSQCCSGHCANCQMTVDGIPNVRVCTTPLARGRRRQGPELVGSLEHDLMQVTDKLGGPFTPPGFYYKTFIRPRRLWPLYEKFLRGAAGPRPARPERRARGAGRRRAPPRRRRSSIGGGQAGLEAAIDAAAQGGESVVVVDEGHDVGGSLLADRDGIATARGLRARAVAAGRRAARARRRDRALRAGPRPGRATATCCSSSARERVVVASGIVEQPLVFPGNDLVGVMLPDAVRRLVNCWSIKPGERAVVLTVDDRGLAAAADLEAAGVEIAAGRRLPHGRRRRRRSRRRAKGGKVAQVAIDGHHVEGRPRRHGRQPAAELQAARAGRRPRRVRRRPRRLRPDRPARRTSTAVGAVAGDVGEPAVPSPVLGHRGDKCFVCFCEDQTVKDLKYAIAEGFDSIELSKRYTTVTMGPCQGRLCHTNSIRVYAKATGLDENTIGTTTSRPPYAPVSMGLLAGPPQEPRKRTSLHHRHKDMGGKMMWTGAWRRPHSYGADPGAEAQHVHEALGLIDVSTLGKILVTGPDAGAFLDRVYPNRFSDLKVGRTRYGVLTGDAGRIMDDGVVARLDDETFYVSATSTGADGVYQWFTWWNAVWFLDVQFANLTGALAADQRRRAERARRRWSASPTTTSRPRASRTSTPSTCTVAGVPDARAADRLRRRARLRAPLPEPARRARLGHALRARRRPRPAPVRPRAAAHPPAREGPRHRRPGHRLGVEPARGGDAVARQGRQGVRVGRQVGDRSRSPSAGCSWMLVGFESPTGAMPVEGGQVVVDGKSAGRVTSVRRSAELGKVIGLAIVPYELAVDGGRFDVQVSGRAGADDGAPRAVLRPGRREGEVVSALAFLSVDCRGGAAPRSRARRSTAPSATSARRSRSATAGSSPSRSPARRSTPPSGSPTCRT